MTRQLRYTVHGLMLAGGLLLPVVVLQGVAHADPGPTFSVPEFPSILVSGAPTSYCTDGVQAEVCPTTGATTVATTYTMPFTPITSQ